MSQEGMEYRSGGVHLWGLRLGSLLDAMERDGVTIECSDEIRLTKGDDSTGVIADTGAAG